jgi:hypothetical protein
VSPVADEPTGFPTIPVPAAGPVAALPLYRQNAMLPPAPPADTVYVRVLPSRRAIYLTGTDELEEDDGFDGIIPSDMLTAAELSASVSNDRLLALLKLGRRKDELQERYDYEASFLPLARDPDDFPGTLSKKERRLLQKEYEAALAEEAIVSDTYGKELHEVSQAYDAGMKALLDDIYGPEEETTDDM